jgi:hypothetical protein
MIDDFGPAAAHGAVQGPIRVQCEQVSEAPVPSEFGFSAADEFAGIFDDLAVRRDPLGGVNAEAMNSGLTDFEPKAGVTIVDSWELDQLGRHVAELLSIVT